MQGEVEQQLQDGGAPSWQHGRGAVPAGTRQAGWGKANFRRARRDMRWCQMVKSMREAAMTAMPATTHVVATLSCGGGGGKGQEVRFRGGTAVRRVPWGARPHHPELALEGPLPVPPPGSAA